MFFAESELSLELVGIFKINREKSEQKSYTMRGYDSISVRLAGTGFFETENSKFSVGESDVLYIPKNAYYSQKTEGETILAIHFVNYSFDKNNTIECLRVDNREYVEELLGEMYSVWRERGVGYRYRAISLFYSLIYYLNTQMKKHITDADRNKRLLEAVDYIHANYRTEQISVSRLSSMCAVSETYFRRIFKDIYKLSPSQYIIELRLEYAMQLLQSRLYTVSEVAHKSGFGDTKYFSRLFKKRFDIAPGAFKNIVPETTWK